MSDISIFLRPRRDAKGRFLEAPVWLRPGWKHVNEAGLGTGGRLRQRCARVNCRQITLKFSLYCRHHDVHWRRRRLAQLRTGTGLPPTPAELAKLYRANAKNLWQRAPWFSTLTIWLAPKLEADFVEDCMRASLAPSRTAPVCLNTLRWGRRRSVLNYKRRSRLAACAGRGAQAPGKDRSAARGLRLHAACGHAAPATRASGPCSIA